MLDRAYLQHKTTSTTLALRSDDGMESIPIVMGYMDDVNTLVSVQNAAFFVDQFRKIRPSPWRNTEQRKDTSDDLCQRRQIDREIAEFCQQPVEILRKRVDHDDSAKVHHQRSPS